MRQIIDGRVYDTETGEKLGEADSGGGPADFRFWAEALYRTRRGAYFLAGRGGAMSHWARRVGTDGTRTGAAGLRALSEAKARDWAERYLPADEYETIFGVAEEA